MFMNSFLRFFVYHRHRYSTQVADVLFYLAHFVFYLLPLFSEPEASHQLPILASMTCSLHSFLLAISIMLIPQG